MSFRASQVSQMRDLLPLGKLLKNGDTSEMGSVMDSVDDIHLSDVNFMEPPNQTSVDEVRPPSAGSVPERLAPAISAVRFEAEPAESSDLSGPSRPGLFSLVVQHYWIAFGIVFSLEVLVLLLSAIFNMDNTLFPTDFTEVPINLKDDKTYLRYEAFKNQRRVDPYIEVPENRKMWYAPSALANDDLSVIYHGENVLTKECLQAIRDVEINLLDNPLWTTVALTDDNLTILRPNSIIRFFDGTYGKDLNDTHFANIQQTLYRAYTNDTLKDTVEQFIAKDAIISPTDKLEELASNGRAGMQIYYYTFTLFYQDVTKQVEKDILLSAASFAFIVLFVLLQTQSAFITFMGMAGIFFSFLWTNYVYRVVLDYRYFGILHALSIFIILGIGSDDLFVFYDMWRTTACMDLQTVEQRFTFCYKHASLSMLITSLTTAAAFGSNVFTPLFGISSFALFTALLVIINYITAVIFFPLCVIVYHKHIEHLPWPWQVLFPPSAREEPTQKRPSVIVRFFKGPLYKFVTHKVFKWLLILTTTGIAMSFAIIGSKLEISERDLQYYREGYNYQEAIVYGDLGFKKQLKDLGIKVYVYFGVKESDMSVCSSYDYRCEGHTELDKSLDLNPIPAQIALMHACNYLKGLKGHPELHLDRDEKTGQVKTKCFIDNMSQFFKKHGSDSSIFKTPVNLTLPVSGIKYMRLVNARPHLYGKNIASGDFYRFFETAISYWLTNAYRGNRTTRANFTEDIFLAEVLGLSSNSEDIGAVKVNPKITNSDLQVYGTKLRYFVIEIATTLIFGDTDFQTGLAAYEAWEYFTTQWMKHMPASVQGYQLSSHDAWHNFKKSEALQTSAIRGIILGSILSFCVLTLATYNVIISSLATLNILFVIATFSGCIKLFGYKLSMIESVNLSLVGGLSVDYVVHFSESYYHAPHDDRQRRVRDMLERMGISVLSGAITTSGAAIFMLQAKIFFFFQFGVFILLTIVFSLFYCLFWFTPMMALIGPQGDTGSLRIVFRWLKKFLRPIQAELAAADPGHKKMSYSKSSTHTFRH